MTGHGLKMRSPFAGSPAGDPVLVRRAARVLADADGRALDQAFGYAGLPGSYRLRFACLNQFRALWAVTPAGELVTL